MSQDREPNANPSRAQRIAVGRAVAELRRGAAVVVCHGSEFVAALAAETASGREIERLREIGAGEALLALTAERARALNILPSGHDIVVLPWKHWFDGEMARELGDATMDLARPLRGPFDRERRPPSAPERAVIRLTKLARLLPAAVIAPLDAAIASELLESGECLSVEAEAALGFEAASARSLVRVAGAQVTLAAAEDARVLAFRPDDGGAEHLAILIGEVDLTGPVLARLHSECFTGDLLGSLKCDCGQQLGGAIEAMAEAGGGVLVYLAQEGRGIGLMNKLRAYRLQADGFDTIDANLRLGFDADERIFEPAAEILRQLGVRAVRLLTNNPDKVAGLAAAGVDVVERVAHKFPENTHNAEYLATKRARAGHMS